MALITICRLNRHVPARKSASWDGEGYVGTCEKCGKTIRRLRKGVWKLDWIDGQPQRDGLASEP